MRWLVVKPVLAFWPGGGRTTHRGSGTWRLKHEVRENSRLWALSLPKAHGFCFHLILLNWSRMQKELSGSQLRGVTYNDVYVVHYNFSNVGASESECESQS